MNVAQRLDRGLSLTLICQQSPRPMEVSMRRPSPPQMLPKVAKAQMSDPRQASAQQISSKAMVPGASEQQIDSKAMPPRGQRRNRMFDEIHSGDVPFRNYTCFMTALRKQRVHLHRAVSVAPQFTVPSPHGFYCSFESPS